MGLSQADSLSFAPFSNKDTLGWAMCERRTFIPARCHERGEHDRYPHAACVSLMQVGSGSPC